MRPSTFGWFWIGTFVVCVGLWGAAVCWAIRLIASAVGYLETH